MASRKEKMKIFDHPIWTAIIITGIAGVLVFLVTACWSSVSSSVFPNTTLGFYDRGFWESLLVEMHGMIVELAVVGVLLLWLDGRREHKRTIVQCREDLWDYAEYDFPEAHLKKISALKRMLAAGTSDINVRNLHLSTRELKGMSFEGASIIGLRLNDGKITSSTFKNVEMRSSNFVSCRMQDVKFEGGSIYKSNFQGATLRGVLFRDVNLKNVVFTHCDMVSSIFKGVSLSGVKFEGANLNRCSFKGAVDIDVGELSKALNLDYIAISDMYLQELKKLRGDMKYQSGKGRP
jgi:hypothetical protein